MSEYVTITKADNQAIADLISQRLDQSGVRCVLVPSNVAPWSAPAPPSPWACQPRDRRSQSAPRRVSTSGPVSVEA